MSPELALIFTPRAAYARLARERTRASLPIALRRPVLVAVVIGTSVAILATRHVTPALVLSTTVTWSYIVIVQLAIALALLVPRARRTVGLARALDLFFAGHAPWSLFALFAALWAPMPTGRPTWVLNAAAVIPMLVTPRIVLAFFEEVLQLGRRAAWRMTLIQQAMTWTVFGAVVWIASGVTARLFELVGRW
jgi:hypothetical protein